MFIPLCPSLSSRSWFHIGQQQLYAPALWHTDEVNEGGFSVSWLISGWDPIQRPLPRFKCWNEYIQEMSSCISHFDKSLKKYINRKILALLLDPSATAARGCSDLPWEFTSYLPRRCLRSDSMQPENPREYSEPRRQKQYKDSHFSWNNNLYFHIFDTQSNTQINRPMEIHPVQV